MSSNPNYLSPGSETSQFLVNLQQQVDALHQELKAQEASLELYVDVTNAITIANNITTMLAAQTNVSGAPTTAPSEPVPVTIVPST